MIIILDLVTWLFITDWIILAIGLIIRIRGFSASWETLYHPVEFFFQGLEWILFFDLMIILVYLILVGVDSRIPIRRKLIEALGILILAPICIPWFWYRHFVRLHSVIDSHPFQTQDP
ncbi:MAG: hypothetical protein KBA26_03495 [Candidatus Delongbacteria bacterium]|nr:hypothetical protein [Candidatus Delongbacteria bacterium]